MATFTAIIGAGFGDEGKGRMVDYCASKTPLDSIVVRYNGGAQAGHTVFTPTGLRHVFKHFGAGSFCDVPTLLSKFFIVNPMLWSDERQQLLQHGYRPKMYCHESAIVTTPYDMCINQEVERARRKQDQSHHGSCGVGINETVTRMDETTELGRIMVDDLVSNDYRDRAKFIRDEWAVDRLRALGIAEPSSWFLETIKAPALLDRFVEACELFCGNVSVVTSHGMLDGYKHVIFEGAQGLMLDEQHAFFPHVTRSRTGLPNICKIVEGVRSNADKILDVVYVTRCYMTRHGAGPFPTEDRTVSLTDRTNVEGPWQGALRYGRLDLDRLGVEIRNDLQHAIRAGIKTRHHVAVTCLDQSKIVSCVQGGKQIYMTHVEFLNAVVDVCRAHGSYACVGESRDRIMYQKGDEAWHETGLDSLQRQLRRAG